jgi:hypothetical protein
MVHDVSMGLRHNIIMINIQPSVRVTAKSRRCSRRSRHSWKLEDRGNSHSRLDAFCQGPVAIGQLRNGDAYAMDHSLVQPVVLPSASIASTAHVLTPRCSMSGFARVPTRQGGAPRPGALQGVNDELLRVSELLHLYS